MSDVALPASKGPQNWKTWKPIRAIVVDEEGNHLFQPVPAFSHHLDTVGDGTGLINAVGNYSDAGAGPEEFKIVAARDHVSIYRILVSLEDASGFKAEIYGSGSALTNGITLEHRSATGRVISDFTTVPVKTNAQWGMYCFDVDVKTWRTGGSGNELLVARWTFERMGEPLRFMKDHSLVIKLHDDFTGLISHNYVVQGTGPVRNS